MSLLLPLLLASTPTTPATEPLTVGGRWLFESARMSDLPLGLSKSGEQVVATENRPSSNHFRAQLQGNLFSSLSLQAALDLYQWSEPGDLDRTASELSPFDLRTLNLSWTTSYGRLKLGRAENRWGLGLVAGGRSASPSWTYPFDQPARGDNVLLLAYGAKMGAFTLGLSGQQVLDDENASTPALSALSRDLEGKDEAYQTVLALRWSPEKTRKMGLYGAYRQQRDGDGSHLNVVLLDGLIDWEGQLGLADRWRLALEFALVTGSTNRMVTEAGLQNTLAEGDALSNTQLGIQSFGLVGIGGLRLRDGRLNLEFEGGYASGDAHSEDDQLNRFSFDSQYQVGLVLVPWFWRNITEETWRRASDPALAGEPPKGIGHYRSRGQVSGLAYLNPRASWKSQRNKGLGLHLGLLVVALPEGGADPFWSFRRGTATNAFGGAGDSHLLGSEVNVGLSLTSTHRKGRYASRLGFEWGVASPGVGMADANGQGPDTLWLSRLAFDLRAKELFQ
ncbi:MAG: hypothetical protein CMH55_02475 [Myxococcales bacterium]|nr:hypothetical protein [Myxococcales bacterium]|tara:strand:+ start:490 stop:2007 length:1518 start_codon:yes stop_codon:yes gene_type:complete